MAAGITIQSTKIESFRKWLEEKVSVMVSQLHAKSLLV